MSKFPEAETICDHIWEDHNSKYSGYSVCLKCGKVDLNYHRTAPYKRETRIVCHACGRDASEVAQNRGPYGPVIYKCENCKILFDLSWREMKE